MKFLLDESADSRLASYLRERGHDVTVIAHDYPHALADQAVLAIAKAEGRILIANDKDFGALIFAQKLPHAGVILFRLRTTVLAVKLARLEYVLTNYSERLTNFIVVTEQRVRVSPTTQRSG
jgi:predicted nuclease of predicted toxin-antitoxin system